jgi:hypothetical protein
MVNIGCVLYTKGPSPGTLDATWCDSRSGRATGKASGGPLSGFAGHYHIRYFDALGAPLADRDLEIRLADDHYVLSWSDHGTVTATGIGMEVPAGLIAGWCDATY